MPQGSYSNRPWDRGNNPWTAAQAYLTKIRDQPQDGIDGKSLRFEVSEEIHNKLQITVAKDGFLKRVEQKQ